MVSGAVFLFAPNEVVQVVQVVQHGGRGTHSLNFMKGRDVLNTSS